ncbi:MAG: hypothetical protein BWZ07_03239 [Alphaproteobacteria bacterium ADurb.BinA280]|nr:MAG: hypothetical protein BWZ07_03239 [Alphaproteobacteria bacterium ADurb.BinA280]
MVFHGRGEPLEQERAIRQTGQHVVKCLVSQARLDAFALQNLRHEIAVGVRQLARALIDARLQFGIALQHGIGGTLALKAIGDVVRHEVQQFLVARTEWRVGRITLHGQHAHRLFRADQGNAQPITGTRTKPCHAALANQMVDHFPIGKQGLAGCKHVLGHAVGQRTPRSNRVDFVHRIGELDFVAVIGDQGNIEVARIQKFTHDLVNA